RFEHANRLATLHEQRFIVLETAQRFDDSVVALPITRSAADAAVNHQLFRMLGDIRIEIVHQHPQRRLSEPALAAQRRTMRRANNARVIATGIHVSSGKFWRVLPQTTRPANTRSRNNGAPSQ